MRRLRGEGASRAGALLALVEDPARFVLALQILDVLGIVAAIAAIVWLALNAGLMWRWQILVLVLVGGLVIVCVQGRFQGLGVSFGGFIWHSTRRCCARGCPHLFAAGYGIADAGRPDHGALR